MNSNATETPSIQAQPVRFGSMWRRGFCLAFYLFGMSVLVGGGFRLLIDVAMAIPDGTLRAAFRAAFGGIYLLLVVPIFCYGFGLSVHKTVSKWQSDDEPA